MVCIYIYIYISRNITVFVEIFLSVLKQVKMNFIFIDNVGTYIVYPVMLKCSKQQPNCLGKNRNERSSNSLQ